MHPNGRICENCRCVFGASGYRHTVADIQNRVFRHVRDMLAPPAPASYQFHFAVLDQHEIVSRGHDPEKVDAAAAQRYADLAEGIVNQVEREGRTVDVLELLGRLAPDGELLDDARGFRAYASIFGQPIGTHPSRMEQCFAIRTAMDDGLTEVPKAIYPEGYDVFVIEDYLGPCEDLTAAHRRALQALDPGAPPSAASVPHERILTAKTAPFLLAEHLQLYEAQTKPFHQWLGELPDRAPGFVFLPFRVLGQYRACAVWMFQGRFEDPENDRLREHVEANAKEAKRWLSPTSSHALLQVASILFLKALTQFKDLVGTPLSVCHLAQQALASLWYTRTKFDPLETFDCEKGRFGDRSGARQEIEIRVAFGEDWAKVLGFAGARYACPYIPQAVDLEAEIANAARVFADVSEAAASVFRQTGMRIREVMNKQAAITAHDYANGLQDLMVVMDTADGAHPVNPEQRLRIANTVAETLLGHAWVARDVAKASSKLATEPRRLRFRDTPPTDQDLAYWRDYLRREAVVSAFAARERSERMAGYFRGDFALRYRFVGQTESGSWDANGDWETIPIGSDALKACGNGMRRRTFVPWPMRLDEEQSAQAGYHAMMMWGPHELMRNACRSTTSHATERSGSWNVSVDASIRQARDAWLLTIEVTNPWTRVNEEPPRIHNMSQWPDYIGLVLNNVTFRNGAREPGAVSYIYEFEVREWRREI